MEDVKRDRTSFRRAITRSVNSVTNECKKDDPDVDLLEGTKTRLVELRGNIIDTESMLIKLMRAALPQPATDAEVDKEEDEAEEYLLKIDSSLAKIKKILEPAVKTDESDDLNLLQTSREWIRQVLDGLVTEAEAECTKSPVDGLRVKAIQKRLQETATKLINVNAQVQDLLLRSTMTEEERKAEFDSVNAYEDKVVRACVILEDAMVSLVSVRPSTPPGSATSFKDHIKMPKLELQEFSGEYKDWLGWWAHYQKVHKHPNYDDADKYCFLSRAMKKGTEADEIVRSFPQTEENYTRAITALCDRFGREDFLIQVYIRELLGLVITSATGKEQLPLSKMFTTLQTHLEALKSFKLKQKDPEIWIFPFVESSLSPGLLKQWHRDDLSKEDGSKRTPPVSKLDLMMEFLKHAVDTQQHLDLARSGFASLTMNNEEKKKSTHKSTTSKEKVGESEMSTAASLVSTFNEGCIFCDKKNHVTNDCRKAAKMELTEKKSILREKKCCYNCLKKMGRNHNAKTCRTKVTCAWCGGPHHSALCPHMDKKIQDEKKTTTVTVTEKKRDDVTELTATSQSNSRSSKRLVLLDTLHVNVHNDKTNKNKEVRVLFDRGSQRSYIKTATAKESSCEKVSEELLQSSVFGGFVSEYKMRNVYRVKLSAVRGANRSYSISVQLTDEEKICSHCPSVPEGPWIKELARKKVFLTDTYYDDPDIEILIGSDLIGYFLTGKTLNLGDGLFATETHFGWTLCGPLPSESSMATLCINMLVKEERMLPDLWSLETLGIRDPIELISEEEHLLQVKSTFEESIERDDDGRYIVSLPWVSRSIPVPTNRRVAEERLVKVTQKLTDEVFQKYENVFIEWEKEGIIDTVHDDDGRTGHYLPHRPILKPASKTTPVRPVFDASCRMRGAPSLNQCMETGPNLLEVIPSILTRFRMEKVGATADVRKAFQMIGVKVEDRNFQKFLWWEDLEKKIFKTFRHCRVLFGMTCSPFILGAVIEYHLKNQPPELKEFASKLLRSNYVDNVVASFKNEEDYFTFRKVAVAMMKEAQMDLRLWESNVELDDDNEKNLSNVLGLLWDRQKDDLFCESVDKTEGPFKVTKRSVLSTVAKIYDPLGILSPATLLLKILLQQAWALELGWDEPWEEEKAKLVSTWLEEVTCLSQIKIPRHVFGDPNAKREIHTFGDGSEVGYGAVVFIRIEEYGMVGVQLLLAKARVAPLSNKKKKRVSISRLELLAAVIATRLTRPIVEMLVEVKVHYWSDSLTTIAWISRDSDWATYVGNRVREINRASLPTQWRHVPGPQNPADLPSRGCGPQRLLESKWWEGPGWLKGPESEWPVSRQVAEEKEVNEEMKKTSLVTLLNRPFKVENPRVSSYRKNVRVLALILRLMRYATRKRDGKPATLKEPLTWEEEAEAEVLLLKRIQAESFRFDPRADTDLIGGVMVKRGNDGLIRVQTRLDHSKETENFKFPVLLTKGHPLVTQLIRGLHLKNNHAGAAIVMQLLREKYWVLRARQSVKSVVKACTRCRRFAGKSYSTAPAPLPFNRVNLGAPFQTTGVDLFGPLYLADQTKVWVVLYTCAVYRCMVLDIVESLKTEDFLSSLIQFISDHGRMSTIYSDLGTNFVGTANLFKLLNWKGVEERSANQGIKWRRNPAISAWWGGMWERLVRSTKDLLKRELHRAKLTKNQLQTCLKSVAATINQRPLTAITDGEDDLIPLTPRDFMTLLPFDKLPDVPKVTGAKLSAAYFRMQSLKALLDHRFRKEYWALLVHRHKQEPSVPKLGDIVLLGSDDKKRFQWPLGKVVKLIPGADGEIRVAEVKTSTGFFTRDIKRLYPLEVTQDDVITTANPKPEAHSKVKTARANQQVEADDVDPEPEVKVTTRSGREIRKPPRYGSWNY